MCSVGEKKMMRHPSGRSLMRQVVGQLGAKNVLIGSSPATSSTSRLKISSNVTSNNSMNSSLLSNKNLTTRTYYVPATTVSSGIVNTRSVRSFSTTIAEELISAQDARGRPSYLDYQSTTPVDPRVLDAMLPFLTGRYGNPHSRSHAYGWDTDAATEHARNQIKDFIGARRANEIIFTSGATESNNLAIKGVASYLKGKKKHIITTQIEHKCVLSSCIELTKWPDHPYEVTYLPVSSDGLVDLEELKAAIRPDTALVSVMMVNNEIGVVQKVKEIGQICKDNDILFHTDAAQAVGKIPVNVEDLNIHLMSISGHKVYGPKGVGALYVRKKDPRVRIRPQIDGGGQEFGLRSGTLPPHLCVGLGAACELAGKEMENDHAHIKRLSDRLYDKLRERLDAVELNGSETERYVGNLNISFACVEGESLLMALAKSLSVSSGSACTSASLEPSYVLRALGVSEDLAHTSLRFGVGRFTTEEEIDETVEAVVAAVTKLRDMSPLWDMYLDGEDKNVQWS